MVRFLKASQFGFPEERFKIMDTWTLFPNLWECVPMFLNNFH